jgi:hypothetical protein
VTPVKNRRILLYISLSGEKPPSVSQILIPPRRNSSRKIGTVTGKTRNPKNEAERQPRFSQLVAPLKKLGEVFVLQPVMNKNLFRFFKFHLRLPRIRFSKKRCQNWKNNGFVKMGEGGFGEVSGIPDPP